MLYNVSSHLKDLLIKMYGIIGTVAPNLFCIVLTLFGPLNAFAICLIEMFSYFFLVYVYFDL